MTGLHYGLTGYARTGKDTIADYLVSKHGFKKFALADEVRAALLKLNPHLRTRDFPSGAPLSELLEREGWDELKEQQTNPSLRGMLQRLGTEVGRALDSDIWIKALEKRIDEYEREHRMHLNVLRLEGTPHHYVIPDVRFLNEAENCYHVIRVHRPGVGPANGHQSETEVDEITPHAVIVNDGTVEELHAKVDAVLIELEGK
jgi:dephospho-CoA kinase